MVGSRIGVFLSKNEGAVRARKCSGAQTKSFDVNEMDCVVPGGPNLNPSYRDCGVATRCPPTAVLAAPVAPEVGTSGFPAAGQNWNFCSDGSQSPITPSHAPARQCAGSAVRRPRLGGRFAGMYIAA